jgi:hypothetical protein
VAVVFVVTRSVEPTAALFIGGIAALTFSLALVLLAHWLSRDRVALIEPWRMMDRHERPAGPAGRHRASNCCKELRCSLPRPRLAVLVINP